MAPYVFEILFVFSVNVYKFDVLLASGSQTKGEIHISAKSILQLLLVSLRTAGGTIVGDDL